MDLLMRPVLLMCNLSKRATAIQAQVQQLPLRSGEAVDCCGNRAGLLDLYETLRRRRSRCPKIAVPELLTFGAASRMTFKCLIEGSTFRVFSLFISGMACSTPDSARNVRLIQSLSPGSQERENGVLSNIVRCARRITAVLFPIRISEPVGHFGQRAFVCARQRQ